MFLDSTELSLLKGYLPSKQGEIIVKGVGEFGDCSI